MRMQKIVIMKQHHLGDMEGYVEPIHIILNILLPHA